MIRVFHLFSFSVLSKSFMSKMFVTPLNHLWQRRSQGSEDTRISKDLSINPHRAL